MTTEIPEEIKRPFNGHTEKIAKAITWVVSATVTVVLAYAALNGAVQQNAAELKQTCGRVTGLESRVRLTEQFISEQRVHNQWTKEALIEIKQAVHKNH